MPLEINELRISMTVNEQTREAIRESGQPERPTTSDPDRESIIAECVEAVLEILRRKKER